MYITNQLVGREMFKRTWEQNTLNSTCFISSPAYLGSIKKNQSSVDLLVWYNTYWRLSVNLHTNHYPCTHGDALSCHISFLSCHQWWNSRSCISFSFLSLSRSSFVLCNKLSFRRIIIYIAKILATSSMPLVDALLTWTSFFDPACNNRISTAHQ